MRPSHAARILLVPTLAAIKRVSRDDAHPEHGGAVELLSCTNPASVSRYSSAARFPAPAWLADCQRLTPQCSRFLRPELRAAFEPRTTTFVSTSISVLQRSFGADAQKKHWPAPPTFFGSSPFRVHPISDGIDRLTMEVINFRSSLTYPPPYTLWSASEVRDFMHKLIIQDVDFASVASELWARFASFIPRPPYFENWILNEHEPSGRPNLDRSEVEEIRDFMPKHLTPGLMQLYARG